MSANKKTDYIVKCSSLVKYLSSFEIKKEPATITIFKINLHQLIDPFIWTFFKLLSVYYIPYINYRFLVTDFTICKHF